MSDITFFLDGRPVPAESGDTVMDAALRAGIRVPSLCRGNSKEWNSENKERRGENNECHSEKKNGQAACMLCLVAEESGRLVTACTRPVEAGLKLSLETAAAREARTAAASLLLGEHAGDCRAPCRRACPAGLDGMALSRALAEGRYRDALTLSVSAVPLPALMGLLCRAYCQGACRRAALDSPVPIASFHTLVSREFDADQKAAALLGNRSRAALPRVMDIYGPSLATLGAAAVFLRAGCIPCLRLDPVAPSQDALANGVDGNALARAWAADLEAFVAAGARFLPRAQNDAPDGEAASERLSIPSDVRDEIMPARAMARGRDLARIFLGQAPIVRERLESVLRAPLPRELEAVAACSRFMAREPGAAHSFEPASTAASACLACGCDKERDCALIRAAREAGADPVSYPGPRLRWERRIFPMHGGRLIQESGKCVRCALCIRASQDSGAPLSFSARGTDSRVIGFEAFIPGAPTLPVRAQRLDTGFPRRAAALCPTAALFWEDIDERAE